MKLSEFIRTNTEPILQEWDRFAVNIPAASQMDSKALRDHALGILNAIADDLDMGQTRKEQAAKSEGKSPRSLTETEAERHGVERMVEGFSVSEAMSEFRFLRASVLRLWGESTAGALTPTSQDIVRFNEAIDQALSESLERYADDKERTTRLLDALLSSSPDLHYILDVDGNVTYANNALAKLYGVSVGAMVGKNFCDVDIEQSPRLRKQLRDAIDSRSTYQGELTTSMVTGEQATYEYLFVPVVEADGAVHAVAGTARDITERKAMAEKITRSANYDFLTGLPNLSLFRDRLEHEVKRAERTGHPLALMFIDLDGFKEVNDRMGHAAGDELLRQAAQRIGGCVRESDTVARIGGDEFTLIVVDLHNPLYVEVLAQEVLDQLSIPFTVTGQEVHISGSIGITLFPSDAGTPENLVRNADQAMYVAKNAGRNRFSFFTASMRDSSSARFKVIDDLRRALPQHQLAVYYQPIVDLADERIVRAEALLRWNHPQAGLMYPVEFIELAEEIGLIGEIDEWVLGEAMIRAHEWSALLGWPFQISVNKSPVEFMSTAPMKSWHARLEALGLAWNSISVEITEGVLLNDSLRVREKLGSLQAAGVQLAIDDFGTGYASMTYLKKFQVNYIKIDQSFVQDMTTSRDSRIIAEAIIVMAHKLGLKVVAEGVETTEQRDWLKGAQCDYAQGYLYSKPVTSGEFVGLLNGNRIAH